MVTVFSQCINHKFALHLRQLISNCPDPHHCYPWSHFVDNNLSFLLAQSVVECFDPLRYCLLLGLLAFWPPNQPSVCISVSASVLASASTSALACTLDSLSASVSTLTTATMLASVLKRALAFTLASV